MSHPLKNASTAILPCRLRPEIPNVISKGDPIWVFRFSPTTNVETNANKTCPRSLSIMQHFMFTLRSQKMQVTYPPDESQLFVCRKLEYPNCRCCYFQTPSLVHCMNATVSAQSPKFLPTNNFCQPLRVMRKRSCTSAGNAQAQLHFRDDQQRAFGISNISNWNPHISGLNLNLSESWQQN